MKTTALIVSLSFVLYGCCQPVNPEAMAFAVNPVDANPAEVNPQQCNPVFTNPNPFACGVQCNPNFGCNPADVVALAAAAPAADPMPCGDFPAEAKPGEVWCCVEEVTMTSARVMVTPEQIIETVVPAVYETYTEQVLEQAERVEWVKADCPADEKAGIPAASECYVLKTMPAVYRTEPRQRLVTPQSIKVEVRPAVYENVMQASAPVKVWRRNLPCEGTVK